MLLVYELWTNDSTEFVFSHLWCINTVIPLISQLTDWCTYTAFSLQHCWTFTHYAQFCTSFCELHFLTCTQSKQLSLWCLSDAKMLLECRNFTLPEQFTPKYKEPGNHNSGEDMVRTCTFRRPTQQNHPPLYDQNLHEIEHVLLRQSVVH